MSQGDVSHRPGYLIKQAQQAFHRSCEERLRPLGLSMAQYAVLRALADAPGAPAAELARRTFVTRQSLRDVLNGLQTAGLLSVADQPAAGRARPVTLTKSGRSQLDRAETIVIAMDDHMTADLTPDDLDRLKSLLTGCIEKLT